MAKENETIADIIAEKRREANYIVQVAQVKCHKRRDKAEDEARDIRREADRLEAAHRREREAITPKSDPGWKDICAKCKDGDIEPNYCKYYGEPNGCNSPIYGEHPTAEKSSVVGDCAKLREALENVAKQLTDATEDENFGEDVMYLVGCMRTMLQKCRAALAAPARNCDVYDNESCRMAYHLYGDGLMTMQAFADWLFAPATEQEGGAK